MEQLKDAGSAVRGARGYGAGVRSQSFCQVASLADDGLG